MRLNRLYLSVVIVSAWMVMSACPKRNSIRVASGASTERLQFVIGGADTSRPTAAFENLLVEFCGSGRAEPCRTWWLIERQDSDGPTPRLVEYGAVPLGFRQALGPQKLEIGRYVASLDGSGRTEFQVLATGAIVADSSRLK